MRERKNGSPVAEAAHDDVIQGALGHVMHLLRVAPVGNGAVWRQGCDTAFFLGNAQTEHEFDFVALRHLEQGLHLGMIEADDDAAAPAARGGGQLDGLGRDAGIDEGQLAGILRHQHGNEARRAFTGEGAAPVLEGAGPGGQRKGRLHGFAADQDVAQHLRIAGAGRDAGAVGEPFQVRKMQRLFFHKAAAGAGRGHKGFEIHGMPPSCAAGYD